MTCNDVFYRYILHFVIGWKYYSLIIKILKRAAMPLSQIFAIYAIQLTVNCAI